MKSSGESVQVCRWHGKAPRVFCKVSCDALRALRDWLWKERKQYTASTPYSQLQKSMDAIIAAHYATSGVTAAFEL